MKGLIAGNVLFGGIVGAGIDAADGAAFFYPQNILVHMHARNSRHAQASAPKEKAKSKA